MSSQSRQGQVESYLYTANPLPLPECGNREAWSDLCQEEAVRFEHLRTPELEFTKYTALCGHRSTETTEEACCRVGPLVRRSKEHEMSCAVVDVAILCMSALRYYEDL
jgi:hypothetical protein